MSMRKVYLPPKILAVRCKYHKALMTGSNVYLGQSEKPYSQTESQQDNIEDWTTESTQAFTFSWE